MKTVVVVAYIGVVAFFLSGTSLEALLSEA